MLPESTVWSVLERLRETEGSPLLLIERGVGQNPDRYALVVPRGVCAPEWAAEKPSLETEIESVHPAWSVIGWRHKALYDAVAASPEPLTAEELFERVSIGRSSGYETLLDLKVVGLIASVENKIMLGSVDLDTIGYRYGLTGAVRARIVRHRAERIIWREWLAAREEARTPAEPSLALFAVVEDASYPPAEAYYVAVMDSGPPD
jgi:hypothetical protein